MYAKYFFERFWEGEQRNELFVCMPFDDSFDGKFNDTMNTAAQKAGFEKAVRVKEEWDANVITDKIFNCIANSKMLLFDLSDDPKSPCKHSKQVNSNVLYELGVSNAMREPQDIVLIREEPSSRLPFDISGMTVNGHTGPLKVDWLSTRLDEARGQQEWHKSKRVKAAAQSMEEIGLKYMYDFGSRPMRYQHFNVWKKPPEVKMAVMRLMDLGILRFAAKCYPDQRGYECSFYWTSFGREVMKDLGISPMPEDKFNKSAAYEEHKKWQEDYQKFLKKVR